MRRYLLMLLVLCVSPSWAADTKISGLPAASSGAAGDELPTNEAGTTKKVTISQVLATAHDGNFQLSGDISPAQLTANQNDWAPTNCATNSVIRVSADQPRNVTGLSCANADGTVRMLLNVGTAEDSVVILKNDDSSSTAANRFDLDHDVVLAPRDSVVLWYDATDSRWKQRALDPRFDTDRRRMPFYETDFLGATTLATALDSAYPWDPIAVSSGTADNTLAATAHHPGILRCVSSTTANSGCRIQTHANSMLLAGYEKTDAILNITTLTNGTLRFGFHDSTTSADAVDGAYIEVPSTGAAVCKTSNNSTRTTSATIATLSISTWYHLRISVDRTAANVTCTIFDDNGNILGTKTNSANIPTTAGRETQHGIIMTNSGTVATQLFNIDYLALWWERALVRGR